YTDAKTILAIRSLCLSVSFICGIDLSITNIIRFKKIFYLSEKNHSIIYLSLSKNSGSFFSKRLKTIPTIIKNDAQSFHVVISSFKKSAELKNPTTGINNVKGTTADVAYFFRRKPQIP